MPDSGHTDPTDTPTADKTEIAELLARYARGIDTKDWVLWRSVFTDDAVIDFGAVTGVTGDPETVRASLEGLLGSATMTMHHFTNLETEVDGDAAATRALFFAVTRFTDTDAPLLSGGNHHHDLVRTPQGWRSRHMVATTAWLGSRR